MMNNHLIIPILASILLIYTTNTVNSSAIFSLKFRYAGTNRSLDYVKLHDTNRLQMLSNVDLPLGGTGRPDSSGLYYAKIGLGTPPKSYYMQVDTGSDITWVNCIECTECPKRGYHGIDLTLYDPKESLTSKKVTCHSPFCLEVNGGPFPVCKTNDSCSYAEFYGDGSSSTGYFVEDVVHYDQVSGDLQTTTANGSMSFGCSAGQYVDQGTPNPDGALDGIIGFGKSNSSMIAQLASTGQVRQMFAHCLDGENGGGIFAIGTIVQPKVNLTPLIANEPHYNINMTGVKVGNSSLVLPSDLYTAGGKRGAIIDIGTTLAYLPEIVYEPLVIQILSRQPDLKLLTVQDQYTCFKYTSSLDDGFPSVTFLFQNNLSMTVFPREYFFPVDDLWCVGWQNSAMQSRDKMNLTLLGDLVLSNKLVVYDLENQEIGWTEYNCSSSIQVKDEQTGTVHLVGAHFISSASSVNIQTALVVLCITLFVIILRH
ncbi:aspartic proteinase 36 [Silene latifolia]|uniref:aspartic proteinase 36 n=1 Tax=Silene latifolia TaxID=37657 RepID=UPI003D77DB51